MEQTKGFLNFEGKLYGIEKPSIRENAYTKTLTLRLNTNKDNSLFLLVGNWKTTKLNIKLKNEVEGEVSEVNEQAAIDKILTMFKDGDSVRVGCRSEVNKYFNRIDYVVNSIYIKGEQIDFNSNDFKEVNQLSTQLVISDKPTKKLIKGIVSNYQGQAVELEFKPSDDDIAEYISDTYKVGDLVKVFAKIVNKPIYEEETQETSGGKTSYRGKSQGGVNHKKIKDYDRHFEINDISEIEAKKYSREDIRKALDSETYKSNTENNKGNNEESEDLPF